MSVNLLANSATVAQLVEQRIRNAWVGGSNPSGGSTHPSVLAFAIFSGLVALFLGGVDFPKSDKPFSRLV